MGRIRFARVPLEEVMGTVWERTSESGVARERIVHFGDLGAPGQEIVRSLSLQRLHDAMEIAGELPPGSYSPFLLHVFVEAAATQCNPDLRLALTDRDILATVFTPRLDAAK